MGRKLAKKLLIALIIFIALAPILWFGRYRFYTVQPNEYYKLMTPQSLEGFSDRMYYLSGDSIKLFVRSAEDSNLAIVRKMISYKNYETIKELKFDKIEQELNKSQSENGCNWQKPLTIGVDSLFKPGYYNIQLKSIKGDTFNIYFSIGNKNNDGDIAYLLNAGTWTAYNYWGGQSLYKNTTSKNNVYYSSTLRPNVAYSTEHFTEIEANGYYWLSANYKVDIYPDYILEQNPNLLKNKKVIVLPYHAEYFSSEMYDNLENLVKNGKSLMALGANQIYWKIKWYNNYTQIECRKDMTFHDKGFLEYGGMWRHRLRPPERFLGARYTKNGINTFAPYKVINAKHWLFEGLNIKDGDLFGMSGVDGKPICGAETDKRSFLTPSGFELIAKGMNPKATPYENFNYPDARFNWNGEGGGDFLYKKLSEKHAILNSGSIQSVSGLGFDSVYTTIVRNFLKKYAPSK